MEVANGKAIHTFCFDFDSTLFPSESLDDILSLALRDSPDGDVKKKQIEAICSAGMEGRLNFRDSLLQRLEIASPSRALIDQYIALSQIEEEALDCLDFLRLQGHEIFVISGGFKEWIDPICASVRIDSDRIFANQMLWGESDQFLGIDPQNPLSDSGGKEKVIQYLRSEGRLKGKVFMVGDGMSDYAPFKAGVVDDFLGFGVYQSREAVKSVAPHFFETWSDFQSFLRGIIS